MGKSVARSDVKVVDSTLLSQQRIEKRLPSIVGKLKEIDRCTHASGSPDLHE